MKFFLGIIIITMMALVSCAGDVPKGGNGLISHEESTTTTQKDGTSVTTKTTDSAQVVQPEAPNKSATLTYSNGVFTITTGTSTNIAETIASVNLLKLPIYFGGFLIFVGMGIGYFTGGKDIIWALIVGFIGLLMIIIPLLIPQYGIWFLLGILIVIGYVVYFIRAKLIDSIIHKKSVDEIVTSVQVGKETGAIDKDKFGKIADSIQSTSTQKLVDKYQAI